MIFNISIQKQIEMIDEVSRDCQVNLYRSCLLCGIDPSDISLDWMPEADHSYPEVALAELLRELNRMKMLNERRQSLS